MFRTNHRPPNVELILLDLILDASDMLSQPLNSHPPVRAKGSNCPGPAERWTERLEAGGNAEISVDLR